MKKVLISAPYMIRERTKIEPLLKDKPLEIVWANVEERLNENELIEHLQGIHGIICGDDRFSSRVYQQAKDLKVVVKWGTGIDSIQIHEANKYQIKVFRTPDAFTNPVADTTLGYILAFVRGIYHNDAILKNGGWSKPQGYALFEKTVGIIGYGAIGTAVAKRLKSFECKVLVYDIIQKEPSNSVEFVSFHELISSSDIITLHCDLNLSSLHLINKETLSQMKQKPFIINTARGPLIDEPELINALNNQIVSGAALDVFEDEPLPIKSPLRSMENVLLASHNSNSSPTSWNRVHQNSITMLLEGLGIE